MEQEQNNYWQKRLTKQQDIIYDKCLEDIQNELSKKYKQAMQDIKVDMQDLYDKLLADAKKIDGEIATNDLYKFNRYSQLQVQIKKRLKALGTDEIDVYNRQFEAMYLNNEKWIHKAFPKDLITGDFLLSTDKQVKSVLDSIWCSDGKHWSSRVWKNKALLQQRIEKGLIDCISRGVAKDEMIKQLMTDFGIGFNEADRIVRTELTHVQGQSTANSYMNAGIKKYEYLSAIDSRTSDICKKLNGKIFDFNDMEVGVNYPPTHVNCRSTVIAVF